jgi:hypothetical protein
VDVQTQAKIIRTEFEGKTLLHEANRPRGIVLLSEIYRAKREVVYSHARCMVRVRSANGATATSHPYHPTQGGCQGAVWMPLLFLILAHYTYTHPVHGDPGRVGLFGTGEADGTGMPRCALCAERYDPVLLAEHTGHCRPCQVLHALHAQRAAHRRGPSGKQHHSHRKC